MDSEEVLLNVDLQHMHKHDRELYGQLVAYPGEVIPLLDYEARSIAEDSIEGELPERRSFTVSEILCFCCHVVIKQADGAPYRQIWCMQCNAT